LHSSVDKDKNFANLKFELHVILILFQGILWFSCLSELSKNKTISVLLFVAQVVYIVNLGDLGIDETCYFNDIGLETRLAKDGGSLWDLVKTIMNLSSVKVREFLNYLSNC
jgi:hypothetical protein